MQVNNQSLIKTQTFNHIRYVFKVKQICTLDGQVTTHFKYMQNVTFKWFYSNQFSLLYDNETCEHQYNSEKIMGIQETMRVIYFLYGKSYPLRNKVLLPRLLTKYCPNLTGRTQKEGLPNFSKTSYENPSQYPATHKSLSDFPSPIG